MMGDQAHRNRLALREAERRLDALDADFFELLERHLRLIDRLKGSGLYGREVEQMRSDLGAILERRRS